MKKQKLSLARMNNVHILSLDQLKTLMGGLVEGLGSGCRLLGVDCEDDIQCCSNNCAISCKCERSL
jgi:hypothetical protein